MKDLDAIYCAARELPPEQQAAYLAEVCADDAALRTRVRQMLAVTDSAEAFIGDLPDEGTDTRWRLHAGAPTAGPDAEDAPDPVIGQTIGRYRVLERIGEGGCGVVYVAEQTEPVRRQVALKVIKPGMDTRQVVARFEAERQALAMMDHPNIAKVFDAGSIPQWRDRPYFVMELVRGERITDYCDRHHLSTRDRIQLFIQVCHAIQHAHQKGIIHRDIKPSNILVTPHDPAAGGVPKVIDFGIAKATEGRLTDATVLTQLDHFIGTPAYMSPEQADLNSQDIDTRVDIYSLGVLLYELLAGRTPFDAKELMAAGLEAMRRTIREKDAERPSTRLASLKQEELTTTARRRSTEAPRLVHQLRGDLDWIVMKCLEKDRTRRYGTANGLAADLERHLGDEPVLARPPTAGYRLLKTWQRHKVALLSVAGVALALLTGTIISTWQALAATRAREAEARQRVAAQKAGELATANWKRAESEQRRAEDHLARAEWLLYASKVALAQSDFDGADGALALRYLQQCQPDRRGWEWRHLWNRINARQTWQTPGYTTTAAFSPDGQRILTADESGNVQVWIEGANLPILTLKHKYRALCAVFSPDGKRIVAGGGQWGLGRQPSELKMWDAESGDLLLEFKGHTNSVWSVAFSPDGRRIVSGAADSGYGPGETRVWDAQSGKQIMELPGHRAGTQGVAFSPDGRRIVTGGGDYVARVWDADSGEKLLTLSGHRNTVRTVAFSPGGSRILSGSVDHTARLWNAETGRELFTLKGHTDRVIGVAFSPDGNRVATASWDRVIRVWQAKTGEQLFPLKSHANHVRSVAFSPDGKRLLTSSSDRTARVWDAEAGQGIPMLKGHTDSICSIVHSRDGTRILTSSQDGTARVWDAKTGQTLTTLGTASRDWTEVAVWSAAFSPDGSRIVTGNQDKTARVWDVQTGKVLLVLEHPGIVSSVDFSPDGRRIVTSVGVRVTATHGPGEARVWDAQTGQPLLTLPHASHVYGVAFSPDGQRILTGSQDKKARIWDANSGAPLLVLPHAKGVSCVAFSHDGQRVITGGFDSTARIWDASTGRELLVLAGHTEYVRSVAFSPDGQRAVTGSEDWLAKVWETATGLEVLTLRGHDNLVYSVAFSPDGENILTGTAGANGKVRIWSAPASPPPSDEVQGRTGPQPPQSRVTR